ncbi:MAG: methyltransferase domain-containing protein [Bacteroidales bacterium]|jgi:O-antigen chain-terminating methyltransferase|nr:methyltransferase domain-containing protein [Bacteroidales bacterium]
MWGMILQKINFKYIYSVLSKKTGHVSTMYNENFMLLERKDGFFIKLAFKYKRFILHVPILNKYALSCKKKYIENNKAEYCLNIEPYLAQNSVDFIYTLYRIMLNRDPDISGFNFYVNLIQDSGDKCVVIYLVSKSQEFNNRFKIFNIDKYKKAYMKYKILIIGKYIPFVRSYIYNKLAYRAIIDLREFVVSKTSRMEYETSIYISQLGERLNTQHIELQATINRLERRVEEQGGELRESVSGLERRVEEQGGELRESVDYANIRIDDVVHRVGPYIESQWQELPDIFESNGIVDISSYLEKSMEGVNNALIKNISKYDQFYLLLANLSRGSKEGLYKFWENYLYDIRQSYEECGHLPVIDIGCGKGDFLEFLRDNGIKGTGVDINKASAGIAIHKGFDISIADAFDYIKALDDHSTSVISLLEVAEHISFEYFFKLCDEISKKVANSGCFVMDTINPWCYYKLGSFCLDPSHIRFPSPDSIKLMLEMFGFNSIHIRFYAPLGIGARTLNKLANYEGYSIVAKKTTGKIK